jgi:ribosomal protein S18 acetylase RimI-like enzyme
MPHQCDEKSSSLRGPHRPQNPRMQPDWQLRPVTPADLDLILFHREAMFLDVGRPMAIVEQMRGPGRDWLEQRLASGHYFGFIAESGGAPIGGVGLLELDWPPHFFHPQQSKRGYVLNVYVDPAHRGRGCARAMMVAAEEEFRRREIQYLVLHASDAGKPLYQAMGWGATNEMSKRLVSDPR